MNNYYLSQEHSVAQISELSLSKIVCDNPWLIFFKTYNIEYQVLSLKRSDAIIFNTSSELYIILVGTLTITKIIHTTRKIVLNLLSDGDIFGHSNLSNCSLYYEAQAINTAHLVCVKYNTILNACRHYPCFNLFIVKQLLACSTNSYNFVEVMSHKSISNRVVSLLLVLAERHGTLSNNGIILNFTITHKILAQIIGSSRVTVTRILSELLKTKLITIQQRKIIIYNPILLSQRVLNKYK
uniref:Global nitrogen transcriptional regulator n=1 Tax=Wildemania schizophylla TaxID=1134705 RepID=A0A126G1R0_WILSC|nr:hypothetical protein [Wildemania schizophylla]AKS28487.1 hypothetical protein [Wildemania schizophylla]